MKSIIVQNPTTSETFSIPVSELTEYMMEGYIPTGTSAPQDIPSENQDDLEEFYMEDIDASAAVDKDIENAVFSIEHSKENILNALNNINILNAAISHLGDLQTEDELVSGETSHLNGAGFSAAFSRTGRRLWMWATGKDPKTMEVRWDPKCLSHPRANAAFSKQLNNYDDFNTAAELAKYVAGFHWRQLEHILEPGFQGLLLPKADKKTLRKPSKNWVSLTGAKVLQVKGGGTQLLWDSRRIWLPTSQIKNVGGNLSIPSWLATKNDMV
tara:strand:- start:52660 stop:53469 length:810 start_codon:yes stop_codon:yes gene_type:complete